jgi:hypothetical protein
MSAVCFSIRKRIKKLMMLPQKEINAKTSDLNPSVMCTSKSEKGDSLCFLFLCSSKYIFYLFFRTFCKSLGYSFEEQLKRTAKHKIWGWRSSNSSSLYNSISSYIFIYTQQVSLRQLHQFSTILNLKNCHLYS